MTFWQNPRWFDARNRQAQLDERVRQTRQAQFGVRTFHEREKYKAVMRHFNRVASKYDLMNTLLSLGIQHVWKRAAIRMLNISRGERILDVCGGTGDLAILAAQAAAMGLALVLLARLLEWTVARRRYGRSVIRGAAYPVPESKVGELPPRPGDGSSGVTTTPAYQMTAAEPE